MKSFVSLCSAILLPVLTLAIPLSQPDGPANLQPAVDAATVVKSTALDSPFASAHHLGHGPVVQPSTSTNGSTHHKHANRTVVHQTYECDQRIDIEYLIDTVLLDRAQGHPGCKKVANAHDEAAHANSSTPSQNLSNPAFVGGGEAAAPPGDQPLSQQGPPTTTGENTTDGTTTGGNKTTVAVRIEHSTNGTVSTTTIRIKQHINPEYSPEIPGPDPVPHPIDPPNSPEVPPPDPVISIPDPANRNETTPKALPPGFTGP